MVLTEVERYRPNRVSTRGTQAIVLGGSMAGLCAARVLSDAYEVVSIIERDELPDEPVARDGAPQTAHPHALLEPGRATLEDLFPGFGEDLLSNGGLLIDALSDIKWYDEGGFLADGAERSPMYAASRPLCEQIVRQHVRSIDNIQIRDRCQFITYCFDTNSRAVTGVDIRDEDQEERRLKADLVVDATGRTSRTPQWLATHGYDKPAVDEVSIDTTYRTMRIERPPGDRRLFFVPPSAPRTRGAYIIPIENNHWEVLLQGVHGDDPPTELTGVGAFLDSLPVKELSQLVETHSRVSDRLHTYRFPSNLRRRYEKLEEFPPGLIVTGDAIASFNPIYGQGMSVAALDALVLHHALATTNRETLSERYFDEVADILDTVWQLSVGNDFTFEQTAGPKPFGTELMNRYFSRLIQAGHTDPVLRTEVGRVLILAQPPSTLVRPRIVWRTLRPF